MTAPDPTADERVCACSDPGETHAEDAHPERRRITPASPPPVAASTGGEHVIEERGRVYDRCRCGWYGSLGDTHVAASTGTSEDVETLLDRVDWMDLWWQMTGADWPVPDSFPREFAKIVVARLALAAREAAARAEERERIAAAIEADADTNRQIGMFEVKGLRAAARIAREVRP